MLSLRRQGSVRVVNPLFFLQAFWRGDVGSSSPPGPGSCYLQQEDFGSLWRVEWQRHNSPLLRNSGWQRRVSFRKPRTTGIWDGAHPRTETSKGVLTRWGVQMAQRGRLEMSFCRVTWFRVSTNEEVIWLGFEGLNLAPVVHGVSHQGNPCYLCYPFPFCLFSQFWGLGHSVSG